MNIYCPKIIILYALQLFVGLFCISSFVSAQNTSPTELERDKKLLESIVQEIEKLDNEQRNEIDKLQSSSREKGEFETTNQFDKRVTDGEEKWSEISAEIDYQDGVKRDSLYKELNEILSKKYLNSFHPMLGTYDADNQRFPLYINGEFFDQLSIPLADAPTFKSNIDDAEAIGHFGLALNINNKASEYLISGSIKVLGKTYSVGNQLLTIPKAMRMAFGNYDLTAKASKWSLRLQDYEAEDNTVFKVTTLYALPVDLKDYVENGVSKKVLIAISGREELSLEKESFLCHGCGTLFSIAVFRQGSNGWQVEQLRKQMKVHGGDGDGPNPKLQKIGDEKYALRFDLYYMQMGHGSGWTELIGLSEGTIRRIAYIKTSADNTGEMESNKGVEVSNSKITITPSLSSGYFDISVFTSGKIGKLVGKRYVLSPFQKTQTYTYQHGKYRSKQ